MSDNKTTTPIGDKWRGIVASTRSAFLRYIQQDNNCHRTGVACRDVKQCGCWLEMESAINAE